MQNTNIWRKLNLQWHKIAIALFFALTSSLVAQGQLSQEAKWARKNNPNYDKKKLTYGFLIGLHTSTYQIKYSDRMTSQKFDSLHSVVPDWNRGFALGFIVNYRATDFLDLRLTPTVAFHEHTLNYRFTDPAVPDIRELVETTMVELPILLKYKSERRGNVRMYVVGGVKPSIEASGKNKEDEKNGNLKITGSNINLEAGFGFDLYYPLFKFSPEIRFSRGLSNILANTTNAYGLPLKSVNTNTITIYFLFQ
ncbi:type IX secretion/gliding motility protein PorT/SprT [Pseudochryseolinea flava]|uniref:PorT family protein n=1 Tax=Pseudochryseolinea flava TaxID=2059302 RepID=A0A364XZQ9_9BACT|nr:porin family protein [Pseudochryseolinea flava]RAV99112.1 PorT family protein [Pseudochryseolinea flava]